MELLVQLGTKEIIALIFIPVGVVLLFYDIKKISTVLIFGAKRDVSLFVKGVRVLTTTSGIVMIAAGSYYGNDTLFLLGLVIGIEELYETTLVLTALKYSKTV